ncbi:MAG: hypothetical protein OQK00_00725 [Rhodobacteraceae bacterium]|nr:hypothetical protein [Paracoccaceae bacterium]MCW9044325.1 hypothetical protein [Pseudopelagicola sp.]
MSKLIAVLNVVAWSGFWAFGYIALASGDLESTKMTTAAILAFVGLIVGLLAYFSLVRAAEASGYARRTNQLSAEERNRAHAKNAEALAEVEGR